jgi:hypothetical protein
MEVLQIIEELKLLVGTGTRVPGFRRKVMVDVDRLASLGEELHNAIPSSIKEADEIIKQKESIVNQASLEAQRIKNTTAQAASAITQAAQQEHESRVEESEIVRAAEMKGQDIKDEATVEAQQIVQDAQRRAFRIMNEADTAVNTRRDGANQYAREVLFSLEEQLAELLGQVRRGIDALRIEEAEMQKVEDQVPA